MKSRIFFSFVFTSQIHAASRNIQRVFSLESSSVNMYNWREYDAFTRFLQIQKAVKIPACPSLPAFDRVSLVSLSKRFPTTDISLSDKWKNKKTSFRSHPFLSCSLLRVNNSHLKLLNSLFYPEDKNFETILRSNRSMKSKRTIYNVQTIDSFHSSLNVSTWNIPWSEFFSNKYRRINVGVFHNGEK